MIYLDPENLPKGLLQEALDFKRHCDEYDMQDAQKVFDLGKLLGMKIYLTLQRVPPTKEELEEIDRAVERFLLKPRK